jgi:hypothetical protein
MILLILDWKWPNHVTMRWCQVNVAFVFFDSLIVHTTDLAGSIQMLVNDQIWNWISDTLLLQFSINMFKPQPLF